MPAKPEERFNYIVANDPNIGKVKTAQAPFFDIWGRRLTPQEREEWKRNAESVPTSSPRPHVIQPRSIPPREVERPFIDVYAKSYVQDDVPKIRK